MLERLRWFFVPFEYIDALMQYDPYSQRQIRKALFPLHISMASNVAQRAQGRERWLVLPYHPLWRLARLDATAQSFLDGFWKDALMEAFGAELPFDKIRISWRLASPHFVKLVRDDV